MKKLMLLILALCLLLCLAGCISRKPADSGTLPTWEPTESQQDEDTPTEPSGTTPTEGTTAPTEAPTTPTTAPTEAPTTPTTEPTTAPDPEPTTAPTESSGNGNEAQEEEGDIFIPLN